MYKFTKYAFALQQYNKYELQMSQLKLIKYSLSVELRNLT